MYTMYMALHITNPVVEQKVRTLASVTGESMTGAIGLAVEQYLNHICPEVRTSKPTVEDALAYIASFNLQPINGDLTDDDILGYGPDGIPEE